MRFSVLFGLIGMLLLPATASAALREADCIVTRKNVTTTTAQDLSSFQSCLRGTTYESSYGAQCDARVKKGDYFGKRANCLYHSYANFYCQLRDPTAQAAKVCYDSYAYFSQCVFYPQPDRPTLAAPDFPSFLRCGRGSPFNRDAAQRCEKKAGKPSGDVYIACLKWEFVYAYCNLRYGEAKDQKVCYEQYAPFIRAKSTSSEGGKEGASKKSKPTPGTLFGDGSDYVWTPAPPPNPSRAQKGYRPTRHKTDYRNTYAYRAALAAAAKAQARKKVLEEYTGQQRDSVGENKVKKTLLKDRESGKTSQQRTR